MFILSNAAVPVTMILVVWFLLARESVYALLATLAIVGAMKLRIHVAGRVAHTPLFWIHLAASCSFFITLMLGLITSQDQALYPLLWPLAIGMLSTGAVLWLRGIHAYLNHRRVTE